MTGAESQFCESNALASAQFEHTKAHVRSVSAINRSNRADECNGRILFTFVTLSYYQFQAHTNHSHLPNILVSPDRSNI